MTTIPAAIVYMTTTADDDAAMSAAPAAAAASLTNVSWQYIKFPSGQQNRRLLNAPFSLSSTMSIVTSAPLATTTP